MLIRICGHYPNNPAHIDKLISIKGLPEEWIFRNVKRTIAGELIEGRELVQPWEPDIDENIPSQIRHLCEPVEIVKIFPPIEKGRDSVVDRRTIMGIRFDFMSQPGQDLWEKVERYLDRMTPRDQKVAVPVVVAPDHKSMFNPHEARRSARGSLELRPCEIPEVDLRIIPSAQTQTVISVPQPAVIVQPIITLPTEPQAVKLACDQCPKVFTKDRALKMHKIAAHKKVKEPAGV